MPAVMSNPRKGNGSRRGRRPMAEINVTPFVDVMLVLLIVFMVTAPLLTVGVPVDLPQTRAKSATSFSTSRRSSASVSLSSLARSSSSISRLCSLTRRSSCASRPALGPGAGRLCTG